MFNAIDRFHEAKTREQKVYLNSDCPVEVLQADWEFRQLLRIVSDYSPRRMLEIGSLFGGTLWHWMQMKPERLVAVDFLVPSYDYRYQRQKDAHSLFYEWASKSNTWFTLYECRSDDIGLVGDMRNQGPFDFVFIDGDHGYEGAKADFLTFGSMVCRGGLIVLHDILPSPHWPGIEVPKLWKEIVEAGYKVQELYSDPKQMIGDGTYGIGVVYV